MAIDTKPNLSNRKFEQCSGDTMNLSGCTQIYGYFDMESGSTLSICSNAGVGKVLTSDATGVATWQTISSGSGENITKEISQATHGFAVGDYIGWSGGTYNKAIADGNYEGEFIGLISEVPDASTFCVTQAGYVTGLTGLVQNTTYFLSPDTAGLVTSTAPAAEGEIYKSVLIANSTTSAWVFPYVGYVITTGTTGVSTANNGLSVDGGIVQLGGNLIQNTAIDLNSNSLCIAGLPAQSTETKVMFVDTDGKLSCGVAAGSPNTINSGTTNSISGITHTHCLDASTFVTGNQGILVDVNNRFYLDDTYVNDITLASLYTYTGVTANQSLGSLPSGQTLGMVYITNSGTSAATVNLGTTPTGNDITPFQPIDIDPDEDVSVTVNMRLSQTEAKTIYINSSDWTGVDLTVQWANITYQNAETTINPGDLPIATESSLGAIKVGDGLCIDGSGVLAATGGTGTGTITGATNLGSGNGTIFTSVDGENIQLKTLSGGTDITITCNDNYIAINSSSSGTITGGANGLDACGTNVVLGGTLTGNTTVCATGATTYDIIKGVGFSGTDGFYFDAASQAVISKSTADFSCLTSGYFTHECANLYSCDSNAGTCSNVKIKRDGNIDFLLDNTFTICSNNSCPAQYIDDYSAGYTCLSIPHVGYVTGLTSGGTGSGGFLGLVTKDTTEPSDLQDNQWVKPEPMATNCFNYTFDNFSDSGGTAISVNLSLCDTYLRYCCTGATGGYWLNESYEKPLTSGYTWIGNDNCKAAEVAVINEWVDNPNEICYTGQKYAYQTQTVFQVDVGCCVTMPNKILVTGLTLSSVGSTCIFSIPTGMYGMISSAKLIMLNDANPDSITVSIGNNATSYNNMLSACTIDDMLTCEVYELTPASLPSCAAAQTSGSDVYFRVSSAASGGTLNANLLFEGYVF